MHALTSQTAGTFMPSGERWRWETFAPHHLPHRDETAPRFHLVQRLRHRPTDGPPGLGAFMRRFIPDHMDAPEFERNAAPHSLARLRYSPAPIVIHTVTVHRDQRSHQVHLVAAQTDVEAAAHALHAWVTSPDPQSLRPTYFIGHLGEANDDPTAVCAWWDLSHDLMWTLCASTAHRLLRGITPTSPGQ